DLQGFELRDCARRARREGRPHDGGIPGRHAERAEREDRGAALQAIADREQARERAEHGRRERVNDDDPGRRYFHGRTTTNRPEYYEGRSVPATPQSAVSPCKPPEQTNFGGRPSRRNGGDAGVTCRRNFFRRYVENGLPSRFLVALSTSTTKANP